jgi:peptidoglycan/LPS O-acetylase OafA/YrhL
MTCSVWGQATGRRVYAWSVTYPPPTAVRWAGAVVALEGAAAVVVSIILVILGVSGGDAKVAFGTAGWFVLVGGGVLAAGWALGMGRRWGRGVAVFAQLLLLPVAWYMAVSSHRPEFGIPVAIVALAALVLLFSPSAVRWAAGQDSASADSVDPDTR